MNQVMSTMNFPSKSGLALRQYSTWVKKSPESSQPANHGFIGHGYAHTPMPVVEHDRAFAIDQAGDIAPDREILGDQQCWPTIRVRLIVEASFQKASQGPLIDVCFLSDLANWHSSLRPFISNGQVGLGPSLENARALLGAKSFAHRFVPAGSVAVLLADETDEWLPARSTSIVQDTLVCQG